MSCGLKNYTRHLGDVASNSKKTSSTEVFIQSQNFINTISAAREERLQFDWQQRTKRQWRHKKVNDWMYIAPNTSNIPPAEMQTSTMTYFHSSSANQIEQRSPNFDDHARFWSIKDSARSKQTVAARLLVHKSLRAITTSQNKTNLEQETKDPPSNMPRNLQLTPVKPLFSRKKGSVMPPRHDSSWRFLGKNNKINPSPKP